MAVTKRYSRRWNALVSFWTTKNHEWIEAIVLTRNDLPYPIDNTWNWEARASSLYSRPWKFQLSGFFRAQSGVSSQRTETFTNPALLQRAVTVRMEPFGAQRGPVIPLINLKLPKTFRVHDKYTFEGDFQGIQRIQ